MHPIKLIVRKRIEARTKNPRHPYETVYTWPPAMVIEYNDSPQMFKCYKKGGTFETDAQFAKLIRMKLGVGIYSVIAFRKGRRGFWGFMKVQIGPSGFMRLKKAKTAEQKEKEKNLRRLKEMSSQLATSEDKEEIQYLQEEIAEVQQDENINQELIDLDKNVKHGCYPYLKSIQPVYREHGYDDTGYEENDEEGYQKIW